MTYRLASDALGTPRGDGVIREADGAFISADPENRDWQTYEDWQAQGGVALDPKPVPPPPAPTACTKLGLKRAFAELGIWPQVRAMIASDPDMQEEWDLATELKVTDPIVRKAIGGLAQVGLPLTDAQVAKLVVRANELVA